MFDQHCDFSSGRCVIRFDDQASQFPTRAGLAADVSRRIAHRIMDIANLGNGDLLIEVGAGTGEIGLELAKLPVVYRAFDRSSAMLEMFRSRLPPRVCVDLRVADGEDRWPADDGTARAIFGSRSLHLLSLSHVIDESFRIAHHAGCTVLIGRIRRDKASMRSVMRGKMRELATACGIGRPGGEENSRKLAEAFRKRGAAVLEPLEVATFSVSSSPRSALAAWEGKAGLAGADVPVAVKQSVLSELRAWAIATFGDLDVSESSEERYILEGVVLTPSVLAGPPTT
jgi:ubiquinone/menaquinone biosynthesis C-methylase UbiE